METKDEYIAYCRGMRGDLLGAIDGLTDVQISEQSLDGWSVKDHLLHIALWDEFRAAEVERISAGQDSLWKMREEQVDAIADVLYALRRSATAAQAKWEAANTHDRLLNALSEATPRGLDASLYGEAGLPSDHEAAHTSWIKRWRAERGY
ncbi:MAG: DinB family protein [Dehalococcoidia bacterium]